MRRTPALVAGGLAAALLLSACAGRTGAHNDDDQAASAAPKPRTLTVFAATSLTATFTTLGRAFERANPGVTVTFDFDGTSTLVTQLSQGAPGDILASADEKNMQLAAGRNLIAGTPVDFATNVLELAVAPGNPKNITSWSDLAKPGLKVDACADGVPCGNATEAVEKATGVTLAPISQEQNVGDVLAKVESGDADAGVVYVTDVKGAGPKVDGVAFPEAQQAVNTYPIAATASTQNGALAARFIAYVTGANGRRLLTDAGFGTPAT